MSISYKSIIGHTARATLPSVDTWGTNMNILRDPSRGIFTQRVDKVGETSEITQMIQDSTDRSNEAILVYARGVNPMVSVSYDNYGNNGGQRRGNISSSGMTDGRSNSGQQSYLPYRIANGGAFRPPTRDQRELLPLSRLPRVWTSSFTNPGFADFSKKTVCPDGSSKLKETQKQPLKACVRPTMTYKLETPIVENYEVKSVIKNPIKVEGKSGISATIKFNNYDEYGQNQLGSVVENPIRKNVNVNLVAPNTKQESLDHFDTLRYIQDGMTNDVSTNKNRNIRTTSIEDLMNVDTGSRIKDTMNISYEGRKQAEMKKYDYMYDNDISLERTLPVYEAKTNVGRNIHKPAFESTSEKIYVMNRPITQASTNMTGRQQFDEVGSREYALKPTVNAGGYNPNVGLPLTYHENTNYNMDSQRTDFRKKVYDMQSQRNVTLSEPLIF